jgi:hypothetical protein
MNYEIVKDERTGSEVLKRTDADGYVLWIPMVAENSDYQRYLNPEAEQSTPIVIDEASTI